MSVPEVDQAGLPALTADQMREVDRVMIEDLGIELIQMMENAGHRLADLAIRRFSPRTVTVLAGSGGNGGGGLAAARHLSNRGVRVGITTAVSSDRLTPAAAQQLEIAGRMGLATNPEPAEADLILDALIGYSLAGDPSGRVAELIEWANRQRTVLALDTPSGLDVTTGQAADPCVEAAATLTLALPKTGLVGAAQTGELYLGDISVPPSVYAGMGLGAVDAFEAATVVRLV